MLTGKAKLEYWNANDLLSLVDKETDELLLNIATVVKLNIEKHVPVLTGNLRESTVVEDIIKVGENKGINVGTDEDQAPYAPYVYFPAGLHGKGTKTDRKRVYSGNDWITRAVNDTLTALDALVRITESDINKRGVL